MDSEILDSNLDRKFASKRFYIILFFVVAAGALLRLTFFVGQTGYDSFAYTNIALDMISGRFHVATADLRYAWRFMLTAPTALSFKLFGVSDFTAALFPYLCSLGNICLAGLLGRHFGGPAVGLVAAGLMTVFPQSAIYAGMLFPEEIFSFFIGLCFFTYWLWEKERLSRQWGAAVLVGVGVVLCYITRETGIFLVILLPLSRFRFRPKSTDILIVLPVVLYIAGEMWASAYFIGDPLNHYKLLSADFTRQYAIRQHFYGLNAYVKALFCGELYGLAHFGVSYPLFIVSLLVLAVRKNLRSAAPFVLWLAFFFLYYEFGSTSLTHYSPVPKLLRYLSVNNLPLLVVIALALVEWGRRPKGKWLAWAVGGLFVLTSVVGLDRAVKKHHEYFAADGGAPLFTRAVNELAAHNPQRVAVPSIAWANTLSYFWAKSLGVEARPEMIVVQPQELSPTDDCRVIVDNTAPPSFRTTCPPSHCPSAGR